ncbi:MAG: NAD(P)/FAD-dependent oxidoreductase, partial [Saprospiraceae bacterium]|nr:NAD(P)/FAD-dependent oxidoreductase [Saprospiraceae bacterium]
TREIIMKPDYETGIIGAGFGGIIAALKLIASGRTSFVVFERASEIGGTWRDNTYPGCACDIPSNLYSIESEPNPDWSRRYSPQPEILSYLKNVAVKHDLYRYIQFDSEIIRFEYIEQSGFWELTDRNGRRTTVRLVISALGPFQSPKLPEIPGLDNFEGNLIHSARWNHKVDLKGKRVAVVGTGASAIQIVPAIAPDVAQLTVFQRTPSWVSDRYDLESSPFYKSLYRRFPKIQRLVRRGLFRFLEFRGRLFLGNKFRYRFFKKLCLKKLEREVVDPDVRRRLTPDYAMGCKRIVVSDDYLPTFNRTNVALETQGIEKLIPLGIVTKDGVAHPVDAIIFATGFEVVDFDGIKLFGLSGRELYGEWKQSGIAAYKGTVISGFPNLCTLLGPNSGFGHNSVLLAMEAQMNYVMQYLAFLERQPDNAGLDLKPEVQQSYNEALQQKFSGTVWASGCKSWYLDEHGNNPVIYPGLMGVFQQETKQFNPADYQPVSVLSGTTQF